MPGGYLGVDIFFVISGYLLGSLLLTELNQTGRIDFVGFYLRRIRRILPASLLVTASALAFGIIVLQPDPLIHLGKSVTANLLFYSNYFFALQRDDYFAAQKETYPLLHSWSLSVEEQFYILLPAFLLLCFQYKKSLTAALTILIISSLAFQFWIEQSRPEAAFFWLPSRFWELAIGVLVAARPIAGCSQRGTAELASLLCTAALAAAFILGAEQNALLQVSALIACLATAGLINIGATTTTTIHRLLSHRLPVGIGLISYSLYLWHWPLLEYWQHMTKTTPPAEQLAAYSVLCVALAWATWKWVEQPCRNRAMVPTRRLLVMLAATLLIVGAITWRVTRDGLPERLQTTFANDKTRHILTRQGTCFISKNQGFKDIAEECIDTKKGALNVLLYGDSYAAYYYPGLKKIVGTTNNIHLSQITASGCSPYWDFSTGNRPNCIDFNRKVVGLINTNKFDVVLVTGNWSSAKGTSTEERVELLYQLLSNTRADKTEVLVLGQAVGYQQDLTDTEPLQTKGFMWVHQLLFDADIPQPTPQETTPVINAMIAQKLAGSRFRFVDTQTALCSERRCLYMTPDGQLLSTDKGHLTEAGAAYIVGKTVLPLLQEKQRATRKH